MASTSHRILLYSYCLLLLSISDPSGRPLSRSHHAGIPARPRRHVVIALYHAFLSNCHLPSLLLSCRAPLTSATVASPPRVPKTPVYNANNAKLLLLLPVAHLHSDDSSFIIANTRSQQYLDTARDVYLLNFCHL